MSNEVAITSYKDLEKDGIIVLPWLQGMKLGAGYDSLAQVVKGDAYDEARSNLTPKPVYKAAQKFKQAIQRVENTEQLSNSLAISASVNGSYGLFSASASADYLKETEVNSYSLFFLINSLVQNNEERVANFVLTDRARNLPADEFRARFGDYFVTGVVSGGTFYSLMELKTDSQQTKEEISVGTEADYGGATFSIGGKFSSDIKSAASHTGVNLSIKQQAIGAPSWFNSQLNKTDVDDMLDAASNFADAVGEGGEPLVAILKPYSLLEDPPQPNKSIDFGALNTIRQTLTQIYLQAQQILNSVNYALSNPRQFTAEALANLSTVRQDMVTTLQGCMAANRALQRDPTSQIKLPTMPSLQLIPRRLWGGTLKSIAPPEGVVPSNLRFKTGVARSEASALTDTALQTKCMAYLDKIDRDVTENLRRASDFIVMLDASIRAFDQELPKEAAIAIAANLDDKRATSARALADTLLEERAQFTPFSTPTPKPPLDFLEKDLNPFLWGADNLQYGGAKFWDALKETTDALTTIANAWAPKGKGGDYYSYKAGLWKQLNQAVHDAMLTQFNRG
jgi:hypothetical protein